MGVEIKDSIALNHHTNFSVFSILKKIYQFVAKVLLYSIILIMIFISVLFTTYVFDYVQNISKGNYKPLYGAFVIVSPSMVPTIKVQDAVVIKNVDAKKLRKGDIITFTSTDSHYAGLTVTHRIIDIETSEDGKLLFRTKGDNNNTADDALVTEDNIDGRVFLKIPKIGYLQTFLSQSYGWIICIVVPCLAFIAYEIVKIFQTARGAVVQKKKKISTTSKTKKNKKIEVIETIDEKKIRKSERERERGAVVKKKKEIPTTSKTKKNKKIEIIETIDEKKSRKNERERERKFKDDGRDEEKEFWD